MSSKNAADAARAPTASVRASPSWSLAARLTAWYAGSAFILVVITAGLLYWALATNLDEEDDQFLADTVHVLRVLLGHRAEDASALQKEVELEWTGRQYAQVYIRIHDAAGRPIVETPGMRESLPPDVFPRAVAVDAGPGRGVKVRSSAGKPFLVLAARVAAGTSGRDTRLVHVALGQTREDKLLAEYRKRMWLILGTALVVCAFAGYAIARRGVRPVAEIAEAARRIRSTTLHERIDAAGLPAELSALALTVNEMLDRLEEAFDRLSRFSADIAHELRTPVNNLRGEAEVALGRVRAPEEYRDVLGSCLEEADRVSRIIDSLLFLARAESPETRIARERVDVGRELAAVREFYEAAAVDAGVALTVTSQGEVAAELDRTLFQRAVSNLVANALAHTAPGGAVTMTAAREENGVRVEVSDTGCGIPAVHLPYVFDRFYRVDHARSSASGGAGLGLAIVRSIATLHGGSARIASEVGRGTRVTLVLPCELATGSREEPI